MEIIKKFFRKFIVKQRTANIRFQNNKIKLVISHMKYCDMIHVYFGFWNDKNYDSTHTSNSHFLMNGKLDTAAKNPGKLITRMKKYHVN